MSLNTEISSSEIKDITTKPSSAIVLIGSVAISLFGIVVALLLVELVFRFLPSENQIIWDDRPKAYFKPQASATLQDYNYPKVKAKGAFRIAVVGDSFTFAPYMQFDDTFTKRLERWLNLNTNQPKVEVINYGVPRYSTSHEVSVVKRALDEQADLILMQITLNDPEIKTDWPTALLPDSATGTLKPKGWIFEYWKSLAFVVTRIKNRESQAQYRDYFYKLFDGKKTWMQFSNSWKEIVKLAKEANKPVIAVVFPLFGMTVNEQYPFFPLHEKVANFLDEIGVRHLDVTESYRDIPVERLQVLPGRDRHPNEIGHRIAAEAIISWLPSTGTIPQVVFPTDIQAQRIGINPQVNEEAK